MCSSAIFTYDNNHFKEVHATIKSKYCFGHAMTFQFYKAISYQLLLLILLPLSFTTNSWLVVQILSFFVTAMNHWPLFLGSPVLSINNNGWIDRTLLLFCSLYYWCITNRNPFSYLLFLTANASLCKESSITFNLAGVLESELLPTHQDPTTCQHLSNS